MKSPDDVKRDPAVFTANAPSLPLCLVRSDNAPLGYLPPESVGTERGLRKATSPLGGACAEYYVADSAGSAPRLSAGARRLGVRARARSRCMPPQPTPRSPRRHRERVCRREVAPVHAGARDARAA